MKKLNKLCAILFAMLGVGTLSATDYITGASGFTVNKIVVSNDATNGVAREFWSSNENFSFDIYQDIEVPDGVYTFQLQSMYRAHLTKNSITNVALYANTSGNQYIGRVLNYTEGSVSAENLGSFNTAFSNDANNYLAKIPYFIVTDGKVKVGVRTLSKTPFCNNGHWFIYNPSSFKLSDVTDSEILTIALNDVKHQAEGLLGNGDNSEAKTNLQNVYNGAEATSSSIVALKEAVDAYLSYLSINGTKENPNDVSYYFVNPKFDGSTLRTVGAVNVYNNGGQPFGWVCYEEAGTGTANQGNALADGMGFNHFTVVDNTVEYDGQTPGYSEATTGNSLYNRFAWAQWSHSTFSTKQSVILPSGSYKLSVPAFVSENGTNYDGQIIFTINGNASTQSLVAQTWKVYETDFILTEQSEVSVDLQFRKVLASANAGKAYAYFDGITLLCYGDPIAALLAEISTKKSELETYNGTIPTALYSSFSEHLSAAGNANNTQTEDELQGILDNLNTDITAAKETVTLYVSLKALITQCKTYVAADYSIVKTDDVRTTFSSAISKAEIDVEEKMTADDVNAVYATLEAARQAYVVAAIPTAGNSFDMTFKIINPSFETGDATGWTVTYSSDTGVKPNSNGTYATNGVDGNYLFNTYWKGTPLTQALSGMPNGVYEMKVLVASDGSTVYLTADDEHNEGTDTYSTGKSQFVEATMTFTCLDGNVVIGVVGGDDGEASAHKDFRADGYWWYKADNFRLTRTFDATAMQNALSVLKEEAQTTASEPMDATVKATLNSTIAATDLTVTDFINLDNMIEALNTAVEKAEASIADYVKLKMYIDMTAVFTDVATYQTKYDNGEYTSDDVEPVRKELNVARYNAASIVFTNKVDVTGWTGDLANGVRSDQHWSGETKEYYDANSWTDSYIDLKHTLSTTVTLPKGKYVLKAAGRSSSDATLRLNIKNGDTTLETVEYTGKGDLGFGIDTSGAANFSADGTYANGNAGRGWEWEFAQFELDAETEVTLHVEVDYNSIQNRFGSFSDITLWMDDATYLTVYGKELDAPLAEAKNLVNTLPMGEDENTALANAIALGEKEITTPAELNEAVDELKDAVANANAWLTAYNAAKAPLVAALERFEADYNGESAYDGYEVTACWQNVIAKVKAASLAKDATDSYDGFKTAANELDAALDAVDNLGKATINISAENKVSTCVLMFDAEIPEELTVYVAKEHAGDYIIFEVFGEGTLPAYTPCLLYAEDEYTDTWEGEVVLDGYAATVTGEDGVYCGAIEDQTISAGYVLQKKDTEEVAKFYNINGREGTIPAGKCWLNVTTTTDAATVTCLFRGGIANNIDEVMVDKTTLDGAIYTLDGKRVSRMERGKIYIINGQKIMVK